MCGFMDLSLKSYFTILSTPFYFVNGETLLCAMYLFFQLRCRER